MLIPVPFASELPRRSGLERGLQGARRPLVTSFRAAARHLGTRPGIGGSKFDGR